MRAALRSAFLQLLMKIATCRISYTVFLGPFSPLSEWLFCDVLFIVRSLGSMARVKSGLVSRNRVTDKWRTL